MVISNYTPAVLKPLSYVDEAFKNRTCPLCGHHVGEKLAEIDFVMFDGCGLQGPIRLSSCPRCGLVYNNIQNPDILASYYAGQSSYSAPDQGAGGGGDGELDRRRYLRIYEVLAPHLTQAEAHILDLGCAKGGFLIYLQERGFSNLTGVDLDVSCLENLKAHNLAGLPGSADKIPLPNCSVDLVHCNNVFEHLFDIRSAAAEVNRVLAEGGLFYLEVPECADYEHDCMKHQQWLMPEHIQFFSRAHLSELLKSAGFEILADGENAVPLDDRHKVPDSFVLGRKKAHSTKYEIVLHTMKERISSRLKEDAGRLAETQALIDKLAAGGAGLFLWGLGWAFNFYYAQIDWSRSNIRALVDRRPSTWKWRFGGRPVEGLEILNQAGPYDAVLGFASRSPESMKDYLRQINFQGHFFNIAGVE